MSGPRPFDFDPNTKAAPVFEVEPIDPKAPADEDATAAALDVAKDRRPWRRRFLALALVGAIGATLLQAWLTIEALIAFRPWIGLPLAALSALFLVGLAGWLTLEGLALRRLRRRDDFRHEGERLLGSELHGGAGALLADLKPAIAAAPDGPATVKRFELLTAETLNDREQLLLFERTALAPADKRAKSAVLACARDVGLLTALSPLGLLDGAFVVWRTTRMLRAVAGCYGVRLGAAATVKLLTKCLRNAAIAGVADIASHAAVEHLGASLATLVSARAGQGLGNALLGARLGIEAMRVTRPLPFVAEEAPQLKHFRAAAVEAVATMARTREKV